jgi:NifU-like protein involved in Fe-S cluster formation
MYSPVVMDHFEHPRNGGKPARFNAKGIAGDPNAGPFMILYMDVHDEIIEGVGFETFGCGPAIAAGSLLTEMIKGKALSEVEKIDGQMILDRMGELPLGKRHCIDIAIAALSEALRKVGL